MDYYRKTKVYSDGSHYIGIPHTTRPKRRKSTLAKKKPSGIAEFERTENTAYKQKEAFETLCGETKHLKRAEREASIIEGMKPYFKDESQATEYVAKNMERKKRNIIARRKRLWRKINQQQWNYFATFTYDDKKHTEDSFRKSLSNCLKHLSSRKGWKYIGAWERSPEKKRLHFHCMLCIPKGTMPGELIEKSDYDTVEHRRQTTYQNTYFNERYGRTDFKEICNLDYGDTMGYLMKYIEKDNGKLVISRGLPQYFQVDIMSDDVVCPYGVDDRKLLLFDDFACWDDGEYLGQISPELKEKLPKCN